MKRIGNVLFTLLTLTLASCSSFQFNRSIEHEQLDLLSDESFMRYNSNRLMQMESPKRGPIALALVSCHQSKFTKGLGLLESNMHQNKENPFYWNAMGTCYLLNNEVQKSIFYYSLGLEATKSNNNRIAPANKVFAEAVITNNLGLIHLKNKKYDLAFDYFTKATQLAPNFFTPEFNIAQLHVEFNENQKALAILRKLEKKNANDIDLLYSLSLVYFRLNDFNNSFTYITKIHKDYINRPNIVGLYAYNLMKRNRLEEAKVIMEKRLYASEFNKRNELILDEINQKIKEQPKQSLSPPK